MATSREFQVTISAEEIDDLRQRLDGTRWPDPEPVEDWSQGVPLGYLRDLVAYWRDEYDMNRVADRLNAWPQFVTTVGGLGIHHLQVRSDRPDAPGLVLTHGWPGSVIEFLGVIEPLRRDFHLVVPSLPGYGWSDKPTVTGTGVRRIAELWAELMAALGHDRWYAQGGDWGGIVTAALGELQPRGLVGLHVNMAIVHPSVISSLGEPTEDELATMESVQHYLTRDSGYRIEQATKPQTVGTALSDSPVGLLAWIVEKFHGWTDNDGSPDEALSRDDMLDDVMVYWLTNTAASSARLYWESGGGDGGGQPTVVPAPAAYSVFPKEILRLPERWARARFADLRYFHEVDRGGHFAAWEQPDLFVDEVRAGLAAVGAEIGS